MNGMKLMLALMVSAVVSISFSPRLTAETFNRVVAIVNEEVITLHELNKKIEEMTGLSTDDIKSQDKKEYLETRRQILELLIDERIAQERIQELGIRVDSRQVDAAIENIKKNRRLTHEDLLAGLKNEGLTYERYREIIRRDLERMRLINSQVKSKIIIRDEQLIQYYHEHQEEYKVDGYVHLAGIFLMNEKSEDKGEMAELSRRCEDILARIRDGEDFGEMAREFSKGPGAAEGGDLGRFKTSQLDPELKRILEVMPEGGVSDPIKRGKGIQIIKLIRREAARVKPFEKVKEDIYERLYRGEVDKRYLSWIKDLRKNTYTKIIF